VLSAVDLNANGQIDLASDRVTRTETEYVKDNGVWHRESRQYVYPTQGSDTPKLVASQREQLTGLGGETNDGTLVARTISIDVLENETVRETHVDRETKTRIERTILPTSNVAAEERYENGLLVASKSATGVERDREYDVIERLCSETDPRTGKTAYAYYTSGAGSKGQLRTVTDPGARVTTFSYDTTSGRRTQLTDALSQTTHTAYDKHGRVVATWGATYPVAYEYDDYGRLSAMATTRDTDQASVNLLSLLPQGVALSDTDNAQYPDDLDTTRWVYDQATGLLTQKVYANGQGPTYAYSSDGKLTTRTWARGATTSYSYDGAGALTNTVYSAGTPAVSFAYDRLGRAITVTDGQGTRTNVYSSATLALSQERLPGGSVVAYTRDPLNRPSGVALDQDYAVEYGYDNQGRLASLSSQVQSVERTFAYPFVTNSELLEGWSSPGAIASRRTFEPTRDLVATVTNTWNGAAVSSFVYTNDAIGRRTRRTDSGLHQNDFGYNLRSEMTNAVMRVVGQTTNTYAYAYDPIGNRLSASRNLDDLTYISNELNQYTQIANGQTIEPTYDADGNLLTFNGWTFTWNGENRLATATNGTVTLSFSYDYMGRRIAKAIAGGATFAYTYDGWNLLRERKTVGGTSATKDFIWGLDLSQTLQGAGGVGGLLSVILPGETPVETFAVYDANGNVTEYVNASGTTVAHYEYDPFGGISRQTGALADEFPHRFSTKYLDSETGLVYYGYRYYSPDCGRFLSRDPLGDHAFLRHFTEGLSKRERQHFERQALLPAYVFVNNSPVTLVDSLGLAVSSKKCGCCPGMDGAGGAISKVNSALSSGACKEWFEDHGHDYSTGTPSRTVRCYSLKLQCALGIPAWTFPGMRIGVCNNQCEEYGAAGLASLIIHELAHHYCTIGPGREACAISAQDACAGQL